jgi:iron complex transport system ATP-binding protein
MMCEKMLEAQNISFQYKNGPILFRQISFKVNRSEILCLIGPNGIGKTTLLHCLAGLNKPLQGEIFLAEQKMKSMPLGEVAKNLGFVPQFIVPAFSYHVIDYVVTGCAPKIGTFGKPSKEHYLLAEKALEQMEISHLSHKPYTEISGGERQLVSIARTLTQRPKVILMDEPAAHLDYSNQIKVLRIIKRLSKDGYTIIMTTHNPDHGLLLDSKVAAIMPGGTLSYGHCKEIMTGEFLSKLYGVPLHVCHFSELNRDVCVATSI